MYDCQLVIIFDVWRRKITRLHRRKVRKTNVEAITRLRTNAEMSRFAIVTIVANDANLAETMYYRQGANYNLIYKSSGREREKKRAFHYVQRS